RHDRRLLRRQWSGGVRPVAWSSMVLRRTILYRHGRAASKRGWSARGANLVIAGVIGACLISGCSQPSEPQQKTPPGTQEALSEQARKEAEEKAWTEASRAGTVAAFTAYLQNHGSGAHAA